MNILQITTHFPPNVGGVETHLNDLIKALVKRGNKVSVLTYRPLVTRIKWKIWENINGAGVLRVPWFPGLFYKLVKNPIIEFLYLLPGIFVLAPVVIFAWNPDVIHTHGLVTGFVGVFWGKIFGKKVITTTHSIYHFPKDGLYMNFSKWLFNTSDAVLTLSKQSKKEVEDLGVNPVKVKAFTYWIDLNIFKKVNNAKRALGWKRSFTVLFVGRLVEEKGILLLLEAAKVWNMNITLVVVGSGPLEEVVKNLKSEIKNLKYLGRVDNDKLPLYYSASDLTIVPSIHDEGFGRIILESLACGTPVIGANRGAIPEAMNETVGKLIKVSPNEIKSAVEYFYKNPDKLQELRSNSRSFAEKYYSENNVQTILNVYKS